MKKIWMVALSATLLLMTPVAWAGGGYPNGHKMNDRSQWRNDSPLPLETLAQKAHERQQYDQEYRSLHQAIEAQQVALDQELNRRVPDVYKVERLHHDIGKLRAELAHAEYWFDLLQQEEAGRYPNAPYANAW
jgi:hypothetical protein